MLRALRPHWCLASVFALCAAVGCDAKGEADTKSGTKDAAETPSDGDAADAATSDSKPAALLDESLETKPCDVLTDEMVAGVLGVDKAALTKSSYMKSHCAYATEDDLEISINFIRVAENIDDATKRFDNAYKGMSPEEVKKAMAAIDAELDKKAAKDKAEGAADPVDAKKAEPVADAMGGAFAAGFTYEDVPGVGDAARLGVTKRTVAGMTLYDNEINVRVRNLSFQLHVAKEKQDVLHRTELVAAAKAVVKGL